MSDADQRGSDALGNGLNLVKRIGIGAAEIVLVNDISVAGDDNGFDIAETTALPLAARRSEGSVS
jgi:hypothetical protein